MDLIKYKYRYIYKTTVYRFISVVKVYYCIHIEFSIMVTQEDNDYSRRGSKERILMPTKD